MKKIIVIALAVILVFALAGCNQQIIDTTYKFDSAIISLPNGEVIEGKVQSWKDFENSDQLQIKIDGVTYLVHSMNAVLIAK